MKAIRFHAYGGPGVLRYEETERPEPAAGEVLIKVSATSFNPADAGIRAGYLQQVFPISLPHIPGLDVAGRVAALGEGVTRWKVGDAVFGFLSMVRDGAAAEYVATPADVLAPAPTSIPLQEAAALPAAALTAWQALSEHAELQPGARILINGAGGGVGGYAVQLAKRAGAHVIATASPRSAEAVRAHGADEIIDYTATTPAEAISEPVDVVLSLVAGPGSDTEALTALIRDAGVIVTTATPATGDPDRAVRAVAMQLRTDAEQLTELAKLVDAGELAVEISATRPLSETAAVHELSAGGGIHGKVLLVPSSSAQ
ncbi:NADP-dependent oxidoreductase [Catenulispora sp. NF23]|uniref:NADP-dependent oxidoreductase n=1 Tax=Catenulispora pinistramenti TaxID=2705254 RepID=UPI001BA81058|nr:NADP-dependent oxidoreductase [Catenulispora pinistramenti]MBS2532677.1 NADP-dependent oxidoreductase [Catenulispora pinistramenti]